MTSSRLTAGQVVRYGDALWRVDFVNDCRARIVPLAKRHVVVRDDDGNELRSFDAERGGVNISPNSLLPVIDDVERAKTEIELEEAEAELRSAKTALALETTLKIELEEAEAELRAAQAELAQDVGAGEAPARPAGPARAVRGGAGWQLGPKPTPATKPGSLKAEVLGHLAAHPGATAQNVARACPRHTIGAVAACLDRFRKAGVVTKSS